MKEFFVQCNSLKNLQKLKREWKLRIEVTQRKVYKGVFLKVSVHSFLKSIVFQNRTSSVITR